MTRRRDPPEEPERFSTVLYQYGEDITDEELRVVMFQLLDHLKLEAVRTNMTKHGDTQVIVRPLKIETEGAVNE